MADAKVHKWQDHANHFHAVVEDMQALIDDPTAAPEDKQRAAVVLAAISPSLSELNAKYGIVPGQPQPQPQPESMAAEAKEKEPKSKR